jgi:PAS domain S-box-containing protein
MTTGASRADAQVLRAEPDDRLFAGTGEMAALCRTLDWAATPLGPVSGWSQSLRTTVGIMLAARSPMFLWWGPELVQIYNDAYRPSFGDSGRHPHALGMRGRECWTDIWDAIGPQIEQVMTTGRATWYEDQYLPIMRNGGLEDVWWTYGYSPLYDDGGSIGGTLVVCQETTQRVMAERDRERLVRALEAEQARLSEVFKRAPSFIVAFRGPEMRYDFVNEAYYQLVGHRELLGMPLLEAIPEIHGQGFKELLEEVRRTGEPWVGRQTPVLLQRTPDAPLETRYLDMVFQLLPEVEDIPSGVVAHGSDVTEHVLARREVERLLAESERGRSDAEAARAASDADRRLAEQAERKLRIWADAIPTLAWTARADGHVEWYNARWYEYTGTTPEQMEGFGWQSVHDPEVLPAVLERLGVSLATGEPLEITFPLRGADGVFRPFLTRSVPVRDAEGRVTGWFGTNTDVESESRLRREAEGASRAKSDFLAVMSHELRTPLNAIGGYVELIEMGVHGPVTPEQRTALERIQRSQRHLLGLINGVLNYAKVDAGAVHYEVQDVPLDEILATCEALTAPQFRAKRLELRYGGCDARLTARADREKTQQIVLNLLSNAVKFTEPGGQVTVDCAIAGGQVMVRVADTGRGIAAEQLERVFQPFVQVDVTLTRTKEGTGLGLAISRDLARGMGGDLTAESSEGVGSTFTLALPAR